MKTSGEKTKYGYCRGLGVGGGRGGQCWWDLSFGLGDGEQWTHSKSTGKADLTGLEDRLDLGNKGVGGAKGDTQASGLDN